MIPLKINVKNFRAYSDETLILNDINLAVVSGQNGAGKSTIFTDAIRFALFGSTPTGRIDDLVRSGEQCMSVEFEFLLNSQVYRVLRSYTAKGRGKSILELHILDGDDWKPLTGDKIPDTEKKILELLHITEETFVSSCLILQGRSNEFTAKGPAERKKVLAQILGLEVYDKLQQAAKDKTKALKFELDGLNSQIEDIDLQLATKDDVLTEMKANEEKLADVTQDINAAEADVKSIEEKIWSLQNQLDGAKKTETELVQLGKDIAGLQTELDGLNAKLERVQKVITNREQILAKVDELDKVRSEVAELEKKRELWLAAKEKVSAARLTLADAEKDWEKKESERKAQLQEAENRVTKAESAYRLALQKHDHFISQLQNQIENKKESYQVTIQQKNAQLDGLKKKAKLLDEVGCDRADCKFLKDAIEARDSIPQFEQEIASLKSIDPAAELQEKLNRHQGVKPAEKEKELLLQAERDLEQVKAQPAVESAEETLKPFKDALNKALQAVKDVGYDEDYHIAHKERIPKLEQWINLKTELSVAEETAKSLQQQISKMVSRVDEKKARRSELRLELLTLDSVAKDLENKRNELVIARNSLRRSKEEEKDLIETLARLKSKLESLISLEEQKKPLRDKQAELARDITAYEILIKAFSRDGIPVLIIENAIPELERIANDILGRMSSGGMNLSFITQKENKSNKNIAETLDIVVRDWKGERPYETFSGGEKFRVDFSIRLALGELLTKRAGAKIEFLIVDEPDGLDSEGMDLFAEVLQIMSERFKKIIAISHQEQLKNAFPVRIEAYRDKEDIAHCRVVA